MKILFLSQVLPYPLDAGPKVRSYYVIRYLAQRNDITLLSFTRSSDTPEAVSHLKSFCTQVVSVPMVRSRMLDGKAMLNSILKNQPFLITRDEVSQMDLALRNLVRQNRYDAIHADQLWMAPYAVKAQIEAVNSGYHPGIILDQHNAVQLIPGRMAESSSNPLMKLWLKREAVLMAKYEHQICEHFDQVAWVTEEDLRVVRPSLTSENNIDTIIPICIDEVEIVTVDHEPAKKDILFIGGMHWPPNAEGANWFAKEIFPLIQNKHPDARFIAVGKQPPSSLKGDNIVTTGYVESTDNYWEEAKAFVVPLRAGGGMRVKILDAWAKGVPIISTTIGAEGIKYTDGKDILIADTPDKFSEAVSRVLSNDDFALQLSRSGKETIRKYYDWKIIYQQWEKIYSSISAK